MIIYPKPDSIYSRGTINRFQAKNASPKTLRGYIGVMEKKMETIGIIGVIYG